MPRHWLQGLIDKCFWGNFVQKKKKINFDLRLKANHIKINYEKEGGVKKINTDSNYSGNT